MSIGKNDFVEVEYTGRLKEGNVIFDTTDEKLAKQSDVHNDNAKYKPVKICIGQGHLLAGLENELIGKEVGQEYTIELAPEKAFGKKDAKLLRLIPRNTFKKQNIEPMPGLQVNIDGVFGNIISATGGRVIVDFNHPLASRIVVYEVKITRLIQDKAEQIRVLLKNVAGIEEDKADIKIAENLAEITLDAEIPMEAQEGLAKHISELTKVSEIMFTARKENSEKKEV